MAGDYSRTQRVADYLKREIAQILMHETRDPRIGMVSITEAQVSRDLAYAKVYVTFMQTEDPAEIAEALEALNKAAGFIRSRLAVDNSMRTTPKLRFYFDESIGRGRYMEDLIGRAVASNQDADSDEQ